LYDDRDVRPGVKFADAELLGIPHQVLIGERSLASGMAEYRPRGAKDATEHELNGFEAFIAEQITGTNSA
jgi:prolyl-tRNA synthetase